MPEKKQPGRVQRWQPLFPPVIVQLSKRLAPN